MPAWLDHILDRLRPSTGQRGERAAARFLRRHGYRILARNVRNNVGEIDLLAEASDRRTIIVVEVKAAKTDCESSIGQTAIPPEVHVNTAKQRKLAKVAASLIRRYGLHDRPVRFDVIGVEFPPRDQPIIRHHKGAFESNI